LYLARIAIRLKQSIQDPQGLAILNALHELDFKSTQDVRMGKFAEVWIEAPNREAADKQARDMCEKLLVNSVMETYSLEIEETK